MDKTGVAVWIKSIFQGVTANVVYALIPGGVVIYLSHLGSAWTVPLIQGGLTTLLVLAILLAAKAMRNLPPSRDRTTLHNIESKVRSWLDRSNLTVKNEPNSETYFRFIVTTDGGKKVILGRLKNEWSDYIQFRAEVSASDDECKTLESFSEEEKTKLMLILKLALARARVGYSGLTLEGFVIFKRIPISHSLSEDAFIGVVWELEAVLNEIFVLVAMAFQDRSLSKKQLALESL